MLLYCYVNLRLINKCTESLGDFLSGALRDVTDEQGEEVPHPIITDCNAEPEEEIVVVDEFDEYLTAKEVEAGRTAFTYRDVQREQREIVSKLNMDEGDDSS